MKKRILSALLVFCLACSLVGTAWAADGLPTAAPTATPDVSNVVTPDEPEDTTEGETDPTEAPADPTATPTASPEPSESPAPAATPDAEQPEVTPTPVPEETETPAPEPTAEATEAPAEPEPTAAPTATPNGVVLEDGSVEYTAVLAEDEAAPALNVVVTAPAGAFDEGVNPTLSVSAIEDENDLNDIEDELEGEVEYDGFAALDIRFVDADGNEIEPDPEHPVKVRIELPDSIVASGIDLSTLAVQHLAEDEAGNVTKVEQVASVADGTITFSDAAIAAINEAAGIATMSEVPAANNALSADAATEEEAAVVAEFKVSGFSYFTITWDFGWFGSQQATFHLMDANGNELLGDGQHESSFDKTIDYDLGGVIGFGTNVREFAPYIKDYEFDYAVEANSFSEAANISENDGVLSIRPSVTGIQYQTPSGQEKHLTKEIYLIYSKDPTGGSGGGGGDVEVDLPTPSISKTAIANGDGTYNLNLSVTGRVGSQTETTDVDVVIMADESSSMSGQRIPNTKEAIKTLIDSIEAQQRVNARYSILSFASQTRSYIDSKDGWASMPADYTPNDQIDYDDYGFRSTTVGSAVNQIQQRNEGTNYEIALQAIAKQLESARENAITVVVFLSDGEPSASINWGDGTATIPSNSHWAWRETLQTADDIYCDQFYSIGIGTKMEQFLGDANEFDASMDKGYGGLINAVNAATKHYEDTTDSEGDGLDTIFGNIGGSVTDIHIKNVTITDQLTENVEPVLGANAQPELTLKVTDRDGNDVTNAEQLAGTIVPSYANGVLKLDFNDDYELKPGYTYTVTMQIQPTEEAKEEYANQNYPNTATEGWDTGTHSYETGEKGIYSNESATLTYYYTENEDDNDEHSLTYPKPVIQVPEKTTATLTLTKTFDGLSDAEVAYLINDANFGWDVNFCQDKLRISYGDKGKPEALTYMAPETDVPDDLRLPKVVDKKGNLRQLGGGDFTVTAKDYLEDWTTANTNYSNGLEGFTASSAMVKQNGKWTLTIKLEVPTTDNHHFYTVFEQHQEVPGYAKINDSNAEYTITQDGETVQNGTGKFVDYDVTTNNVYEDMKTEVAPTAKQTVTEDRNGEQVTYSAELQGEEAAIFNKQLTYLEITKDTTIEFTNHYTGDLDVTKEIGDGNEYGGANNATYTLTIAPAHPVKIDFEKDDDAESVEHGLADKVVHYTVDGGTEVEQATLDENGSFTIDIKPDQIIHFVDMPAIQWQVTEDETKATVEGYTLDVDYSDSNNGVVNDVTHWNEYVTGDTIGGSDPDDGIASVDSAVRDNEAHQVAYSSVAKVTVTNVYTPNNTTLTVTKHVEGPMGDTSDKNEFSFVLKLKQGNEEYTDEIGFGDKTLQYDSSVGGYPFTLYHDQTATFTIPYGLTATVVETDPKGYKPSWRVDYNADAQDQVQAQVSSGDSKPSEEQNGYTQGATTDEIKMMEAHSVDFRNFRDVVAPTGLESNHTAPYTLIITAAGLAGLALIGSVVARRVRRRREE